jgi:hypothetical protein
MYFVPMQSFEARIPDMSPEQLHSTRLRLISEVSEHKIKARLIQGALKVKSPF